MGPRDTSDDSEVGRYIEILLAVVLCSDSSATKIETSSSVAGKMMNVVQCLTTSFLPSLKFRGAAGKSPMQSECRPYFWSTRLNFNEVSAEYVLANVNLTFAFVKPRLRMSDVLQA